MINKTYLYTTIWDDLNTVSLISDSLYLYAHAPEDRSVYCAQALAENNPDTTFVQVSVDDQDQMKVKGRDNPISLSSTRGISMFLSTFNTPNIYIEVTGMSCRLAAPLMRCAIEKGMEVHVVYSEPKRYLLDEFKKEGLNQDLSEACGGLIPLPSFAHIVPFRTEPIFVILLGFEGGRFWYVINQKSLSYDKIKPIVGVPGYCIDYPYETYWGNRHPLQQTKAWERVEFAEANSIVDSYMTLKRISYEKRNPNMVVAPIGTKPHAIGAILYAIKNSERVELLYDNPKRSLHRTEGVGKILVCNVTKLFNEN